MATRDEMVSALRGAHEAGDTEAATRIAGMIRRADAPADDRPIYSNEGRSRPETTRQTIERLYAEGAAPQIGKVVKDAAIGLYKGTRDMIEGLDKQVVAGTASPIPTNHPVAQAAEAYVSPESVETNRMYDEAGPVAGVTRVIPEIALTAVPIAGAGGKIATGARYLLPQAVKKFAPAIGDIAANAGYEAAKAAATGEDVASAAGWGAAGAAGGRVLTRTLGGVKPLLRKESQELIDRGIYPTPGQAIGGVAGNIEDKLLSLPIAGDIGQAARRRVIGEYDRARINDSLQPFQKIVDSPDKVFDEARQAIGSPTVSGTGADAIEAAEKKISAAFTHALDGMDMAGRHIDEVIGNTRAGLDNIALLDAGQAAKLNHYVDLRMAPHLDQGGLTGEAAKALDSEMGHYARKYSRSVNPADHPLGEAFYMLQQNWRSQMAQAADDWGLGHRTALLNAANAAHKNLLPLVKASDKAMAQGGVFTPNQLQRSYGPYHQTQSDLDKAAQAVLPSRVPDSGTAGRLMLGAITGGAGVAGAGLGATAAAGLAAYALTSRTGLRLLYKGIVPTLTPKTRAFFMSLPSDKQREFIERYMSESPSIHQMAAQIGRQLATQGQQQ